MVKVIGYKTRVNKAGEEFYVLELQGSVVPVRSKESGRMYFTTKSTTVSTTFNEETCKDLIGMQFPGQIVKVECDPYDYTTEDGEIITLDFRWTYEDDTFEMAPKLIEEEAVL